MAFNDLIQSHFTPTEMTQLDTLLGQIEALITAKCRSLTNDERTSYGSINEQNKLLVNKVREYRQNQSSLSSPDVNWTEFEADFQDRVFLDTRLNRIETIVRMMSDTKIIHDHDNYQNSLLDYRYTRYKAESEAPGYGAKYDDCKQFFPNTGTSNNNNPSS